MGVVWSLLFSTRYHINNNSYKLIRRIGEGGFSYVYHVRSSRGDDFALKRLLIQLPEQQVAIDNEIKMCQRFQHENLIKLVDHVINEGNQTEALLLFPYYQNGSLQNLIDHHYDNHQPIEEQYIIQLFRGICKAIKVMHTSHDPIAHRDITPTNLLLSNNKQSLILTDLGSASVARTTISNRQEAIAIQEQCAQTCTAPYRAPELFEIPYLPYNITEVTDIWSLGCCLFIAAFRICPFDGSALAAVSGRIPFPQQHGYSEHLCSLITQMLTVDASARINISQIIIAMDTTLSS